MQLNRMRHGCCIRAYMEVFTACLVENYPAQFGTIFDLLNDAISQVINAYKFFSYFKCNL